MRCRWSRPSNALQQRRWHFRPAWRLFACGLVLCGLALPAGAGKKNEAASGTEACVPFTEARRHLGKKMCLTGTVQAVTQGEDATYLNFCADYRSCGLSVVVFDDDLNRVGDVRTLLGKEIVIRGKVEEYDGRPEIVLSQREQLDKIVLPPVPREFDVTQRGHASAGQFRRPHRSVTPSGSKHHRTAPNPEATIAPDDVEEH